MIKKILFIVFLTQFWCMAQNTPVPIYANLIQRNLRVPPPPLPNLIVKMLDYNGNLINTYTFATNANFISHLAIFTVQIMPPSNSINVDKNAIIPFNSENSYAILYTLQSPDGLYFQEATQYPTTSSANTVMPIRNGVPQFPITIQISTTTQLLTSIQIAPSLAGMPISEQQQLFNGISTITQKFLLATDNMGAHPIMIPMSGSYDPNTNEYTPVAVTALLPETVTTINPVPSTALVTDTPLNTDVAIIAPITVTLYNGTTPYKITFTQTSIGFTNIDLLNGILLQLFIYPPLYQNGPTASNTFTFVATLQTSDGLKFQKLVNQAIPFTTYPITFTISTTSLEGNLTTFTSNLANPSITPPLYNMLSPVHLRCRLQQTDTNTIVLTIV
jgi:hypothetical protein